jgi:hypothetical protein
VFKDQQVQVHPCFQSNPITLLKGWLEFLLEIPGFLQAYSKLLIAFIRVIELLRHNPID